MSKGNSVDLALYRTRIQLRLGTHKGLVGHRAFWLIEQVKSLYFHWCICSYLFYTCNVISVCVYNFLEGNSNPQCNVTSASIK